MFLENAPADFPCTIYHSARLRADGKPEFCFFDSKAYPFDSETATIPQLAEIAGERNVKIEVEGGENEPGDKADLPPDIILSGPSDTVRSFIKDQLLSGPVFCFGITYWREGD